MHMFQGIGPYINACTHTPTLISILTLIMIDRFFPPGSYVFIKKKPTRDSKLIN